MAIPTHTFVLYHLTYAEVVAYFEKFGRIIINLNYYRFLEDLTEEIIENG